MFKALASKFNNIFSSLSKKTITEEDVNLAIKEIRIALLEADVSLEAVKAFVESLKQKFAGEEVIKKTNPAQTIIKLTQDEIEKILGENHEGLKQNVSIIMMVGLQGSGKTTTSGKLSLKFVKEGKKVLLASLDVRRPAAREQLAILATKTGAESLPILEGETAFEIAEKALKIRQNYDVIIFDTAGRNQIEEDLMVELEKLKSIIKPEETLLVMDSGFGRQSLNLGQTFEERVGITGVILTRMETESRGGIAFNVKYFLKKPIKFYGSGEKMEDLEEFYPERIASRILDMGDVVTLVEEAKKIIDEKEAKQMEEKMIKGEFTFEDFLSQIRSLKKMGGFSKIMSLIPGASKLSGMVDDEKQKQIWRQEAIILSMTKKERRNPSLLFENSRKIRIAKGSGTKLIDVNKLLKQFDGMKMMMKQFGKIDKSSLENMKNPEDLMKIMKK